MLLSNLELLRHIRDEIDFTLLYTKSKTQEQLLQDDVLCRAVVRSIEIIGEAAKKIDEEFKSEHPQIEWKKIAGTRNKLIHEYFGVDYDIIWDIIQNKLPELKDFVDEIIKA